MTAKMVTTRIPFGFRRALEIDGEAVSWLNVHDLKMRIGPAIVRVGGIGGVATNFRHRMKGYSRRVMTDTTRFMKEQGFDVALLFGIDSFYHKFGYAPCMPEMSGSIRTRDAERIGKARGFRIRRAAEKDYPAISRLYAKNVENHTLMMVRTPKSVAEIRHGSEWRRVPEIFVVENPARRFAGYFIRDAAPAVTTLCEVETSTADALPAILAALTREAVNRRDGEITFHLAQDHPMTHLMRRLGCEVKARYRNTGGAMGRILNQDALLDKVGSAYVHDCSILSGCKQFAVDVTTEFGTTKVPVPFTESRPKTKSSLKIPAMTLFQLITGFRDPDEVAKSPGVSAKGGGMEAVSFFHPGYEPYMYVVDYF